MRVKNEGRFVDNRFWGSFGFNYQLASSIKITQ